MSMAPFPFAFLMYKENVFDHDSIGLVGNLTYGRRVDAKSGLDRFEENINAGRVLNESVLLRLFRNPDVFGHFRLRLWVIQVNPTDPVTQVPDCHFVFV